MMHKLYCIYKNGLPLESNKRNIKRNAFDKIGSARSIITTLVWEETKTELEKLYGLDYYYTATKDQKAEVEKEIRNHYEVKEYVLRA